jgi:hypothetical protein
MLHNIRQTSLEAHDYVQSSGKAETQENMIINLMEDNRHLDFTSRELASTLSMETSTMAARVNSLVKAGKILEMTNRRKCSVSGITAAVLQLPPIQKQLI